jgi:hypothetical protein
MFQRFTFAVALLGASVLPAIGQTGQNAMVRAVHASPDAPAVDVWLDGKMAFQGLRFKDYTDYAQVPSGNHTLQIVVSGTTTQVLGGPVNLQAGAAYTFMAAGRVSNLGLISLGDLMQPPSKDLVNVRVVHGAATAPSVDVYVSTPFEPLPAQPVLSGVPFGIGSGYLTVPAGNYQARVAVAGTKNVAINSGRLALPGGSIRTVVALDPSNQGGPFELWAIPDSN